MLSPALNTQQLSWESPGEMLSVHKAPFLKHNAGCHTTPVFHNRCPPHQHKPVANHLCVILAGLRDPKGL